MSINRSQSVVSSVSESVHSSQSVDEFDWIQEDLPDLDLLVGENGDGESKQSYDVNTNIVQRWWRRWSNRLWSGPLPTTDCKVLVPPSLLLKSYCAALLVQEPNLDRPISHFPFHADSVDVDGSTFQTIRHDQQTSTRHALSVEKDAHLSEIKDELNVEAVAKKIAQHKRRVAILNNTEVLFPCFSLLKTYSLYTFISDVAGGVSMAGFLIPQSLAYAMIAHVPPAAGLFSALVGCFVYPLFASSRHLSVAPGSMMCAILFEGINRVAPLYIPEVDDVGVPTSQMITNPLFLQYATICALLSGVIQLLMGLTDLLIIVDYLSRPVVSAFTAGASVVIISGQLPMMLGLTMVGRHEGAVGYWVGIFKHFSDVNLFAFFACAVPCLVILLLFKQRWFVNPVKYPALHRALSVFPASLIVSILATAAVFLFHLAPSTSHSHSNSQHHVNVPRKGFFASLTVPVLGEVKVDALTWQWPALHELFFDHSDHISTLMLTTVSLTLVGLVEAFATIDIYATQHKYSVDNATELRALGIANVFAGLIQGIPINGGLPRSALMASAGAFTPLAQVYGGVVVLVVILCLTPCLTYLPLCLMGVLVSVTLLPMCDFSEMKRLFQLSTADFLVHVVTLFLTIFLGVIPGIMSGCLFSIVIILHRAARPTHAVLGVVGGDHVLCSPPTICLKNDWQSFVHQCSKSSAAVAESLGFAVHPGGGMASDNNNNNNSDSFLPVVSGSHKTRGNQVQANDSHQDSKQQHVTKTTAGMGNWKAALAEACIVNPFLRGYADRASYKQQHRAQSAANEE